MNMSSPCHSIRLTAKMTWKKPKDSFRSVSRFAASKSKFQTSMFPYHTAPRLKAKLSAKQIYALSSAASTAAHLNSCTWQNWMKSPTARSKSLDMAIIIKVAGRQMQQDFEPVLERQVHYFVNGASGIQHVGQRDIAWIRISN